MEAIELEKQRLSSQSLVPQLDELRDLLEVDSCEPSYDLLTGVLLHPLKEFLSFEGKRLRTEMIEIAFLAAGGTLDPHAQERLDLCSQFVEGLHAGSMIIDDIQDQSEIRRGRSAFHCQYGLGVALNAGNWLYFQSLDKIRKLRLIPEQEIELQHYIHKVLIKAHMGQAIDVGVSIPSLPQEKVASTCLTVMELKTGALMSLAFDLGWFMAQPCILPSSNGRGFAKRFGMALQMFDDIGNFLASPPKGKEDIKNGRPSFIWLIASKISSQNDYLSFIEATQKLPDDSFLNAWSLSFNLIQESKKVASQYLWRSLDFFQVNEDLNQKIQSLFHKLEGAYV